MSQPKLTYALAMAAFKDAADRSARANGRKFSTGGTLWTRDDYDAAVAETAHLFDQLEQAHTTTHTE